MKKFIFYIVLKLIKTIILNIMSVTNMILVVQMVF